MLSQREVSERLAGLPHWSVRGHTITRRLSPISYDVSVALINDLADVSRRIGHHADIHLSFDSIRFSLSTHDENSLTERDFLLAENIDGLITAALKTA